MQAQSFRDEFRPRATDHEAIVLRMLHNGTIATTESLVLSDTARGKLDSLYGTNRGLDNEQNSRNGESSAALAAAGSSSSADQVSPQRPPPGLDYVRPVAKILPASSKRRSVATSGALPSNESATSGSRQAMPPPPSPGYPARTTWYDNFDHQWTNLGPCCSICKTRKLQHHLMPREERFPLSDACWYCKMPQCDHHGYCCSQNWNEHSRNMYHYRKLHRERW